MDEETRRFREEFLELLKKAEKLKDGVHTINIKELLLFNETKPSLPGIALIRDNEDRILTIPKDRGKVRSDSLVDFGDLIEGMQLRLFVKNQEILRVLKIGV